jgi:penicillin-binding protein 1B
VGQTWRDSSSRLYSRGRVRVIVAIALLAFVPVFVVGGLILHLYVRYGALVEHRLAGERWSGPSRLYSRPFTIRRERPLTPDALVQRLNAVSYAEKRGGDPEPGEFVLGDGLVTIHPRPGHGASPERIMVFFDHDRVVDIRGLESQKRLDEVSLEPELITYLVDGPRSKQRRVKYDDLPPHLIDAVLAVEDRRFFQHPGVDLFRTVAAAFRNFEAESYIQGGSTITQQLVKNFFLTPQKTMRRKLQEALLAFVLERRANKREILELYVNEVYLGQVGSFGVHGVGEAARLYFGKDVGNLSLNECATLAGLIQSPNRYNPYRHADEMVERRNSVLQAMLSSGFLPPEEAHAAAREPLLVARETVDTSEAPYFVDFVKKELARDLGARSTTEGLSVYTSLDPYLQSVAQDVLAEGLAKAEKLRRRRRGSKPPDAPLQGALIALEPSTGAVLAMVGGRSYASSQFDRATEALRQPGSTFKPFVYLAAFEATFEQKDLPPLTPATLVEDAPATFYYEEGSYSPSNNGREYLGFVTLRRALAMSLNVATLKVAEVIGYSRIATLFTKITGRDVKPYPSVALGTFEATPLEMASAYASLAAGGVRIAADAVSAIRDDDGKTLTPPRPTPERIAHPQSAFLVTNMLRSVLNEGTASAARSLGFKADAAGKTGTTDDTRDAWFIGYTPDLLCVVWVGYDDNTPLKLTGAEAALPIWTEFMKKATAGVKPHSFSAPSGVVFADIDRETGLLATSHCPRVFKEAFIAGAAPVDTCLWHDNS